jgi:hypothetical protein
VGLRAFVIDETTHVDRLLCGLCRRKCHRGQPVLADIVKGNAIWVCHRWCIERSLPLSSADQDSQLTLLAQERGL